MLQALLEADGRFHVVGVAGDGETALELAAQLAPDVVLMDLAMPGLDGFTATARIRADCPGTAVLVLTGSSAARDVDAARAAGAAGYVTKSMLADHLADAILACR